MSILIRRKLNGNLDRGSIIIDDCYIFLRMANYIAFDQIIDLFTDI